MIGVDLIGGIRRAYFEQRLPIKEIVRRLAVSRATVRRVIRRGLGGSTTVAFKGRRRQTPSMSWKSSTTSSMSRSSSPYMKSRAKASIGF